MPDDLRTSAVIGARLMAGWACAAVAVLDLSMGLEPGSYLLFHLVLVVGGLLLLGFGKLPKTPNLPGYAVTLALSALATVLAALPSTSTVCCLRNFQVRHGYPLTLLAGDPGQTRHFAPAHAVADLVFWFLLGLVLLTLVTQVLPARRPASSEPVARAEDQPAARIEDQPAGRAEDQAAHAERRAVTDGAPVADDENVGGLP